MLNNPIRFKDPSGHKVTCDADENCNQSQALSRLKGLNYWKRLIKDEFGITLKDGGAEHPHFVDKRGNPTSHGLTWDEKNAQLVFSGLSSMDNALGGNLRNVIGSVTFSLNSHPNTGSYFGYTTSLYGNVVDFYVTTTIPLQNLFHEFGHVLDNSTGDTFTTSLGNSVNRADDGTFWFGGDGVDVLDPSILLTSASVDDPYFGPNSIPALQHNDGTKGEQWADIWANYAAGNIDLSQEAGHALNNWVTTQLGPYVGTP